MQALDRTAPILPLRPALPERHTHDYVRHGTTTLFAALNVATGQVVDACHERHRHQEFLAFLKQVARGLPEGAAARGLRQLRHPQAPGCHRLARQTPSHPTALHPDLGQLAEPGRDLLRIITRQAIRRGTFTSVKDLVTASGAFIDGWNERCQPFVWTKTADEILPHAQPKGTSFTRH